MLTNKGNTGVWISSGVAVGVSVGVALGYIVPGIFLGALSGWIIHLLKN